MTFSANRRNGIREISVVVTLTSQTGPNHRNAIEPEGRVRNDAGTVEGDSGGVKGEVRRARTPIWIAALAGALALGALVHQLLVPIRVDLGWGFRGFSLIMAVPYVVLGTIIAIRAPENRIGRFLLAMGSLFVVAGAANEYALRGLVYRPGSLPGAIYAGWYLQWAWVVMFGMAMFVFLLFPNGRFASERWRRFSYFAGASIVLGVVALSLTKGPLDSFTTKPVFQNPIGLETFKPDITYGPALMPWLICLATSAASLFIRFRKATGVERQQLKWLAMGAVFTALSFFSAGSYGPPWLGEVLTTVGIVLLPTTIGISILRYRLYEIDVLINRAIVYALLTVALAGAYVGLVFGFQALLAPFTAESDLAIAGSTLGVAALFRPLRSRVQDFIDRRFYRRKFDAEQTVADFSVRLRDEVELSAVTSQLTGVVQETMEPAHVSLWMRPVVER